MKKTPRELLDIRWAEMETEFSTWKTQAQEVSRFLLPRAGRYTSSDRNKGGNRYNNIIDNEATRALRVLGAGLMGGATSPARPWFRLGVPDDDLMELSSVKIWLSRLTKDMLGVFQRSNTYRALHSMYEELGAFGTAASIVLDDFDNVIHLYPLTYGEYRLATDAKNNVNTLAREFEMQVSQVVGEFGIENVSMATRNLFESGNLGAWVKIRHFIEPNIDRDPRMKDKKNMAWRSIYYEVGSNEDKFLREGGFKKFRVLAPRWSSTNDIYGDGPGMETLGTIKQLQHEQIRKGEGIDYQTRPPVQAPTSMKNRELNRLPGGVSYVDMNATQAKVQTLFDVQLNLQHLLMDIQDVRERIRGTFYVDLFLMLANDNRSGITATEVAERHEEKLLMLGPVLERLHNELLDPLISITFERMLESGLVEPPPPELEGTELQVEFVSMLAQAQRAISTNSIDRYVIQLGTIAQFKPEVLDRFDADQWAETYADMLGVDPELIVDQKIVEERRAATAKQMQQAQQLAAAEQMSKTAKNMATSPTDSENALTDVLNQFSGYSTPQANV